MPTKIGQKVINDYSSTAIIAGDERISFAEMLGHVRQFASAACVSFSEQENLKPQVKGGRTIIFSENRVGWVYAIFAVWLDEDIAVPVDAMSTVGDVAYILRDCQPERAWVSRATEDVMRRAVSEAGTATEVIVMEDLETLQPPVTPAPEASGMDRLFVRDEERTALIVYTSGTTGQPKGVMLSFRNMFANVRSVSDEVPIYHNGSRTMVLLPLHHVLPLLGTLVAPMMLGAGIIICPSMAAADIMATLATGEVHLMVGVPRLWVTIYKGIKKKIDASALTRLLFRLCARVGSMRLSRLVFATVHRRLGGHLESCVNGGAALPVEVAAGMKTLGLDLLDGYGMTETAPVISFTRPGDLVPGSVGKAMPSVQVKLVDGELCVKGPNVMQGYYNRPDETAAVMDDDGFLHTGDLARITPDGRIFITGRTKEIIVLSNGKNVNPVDIELQLEQHADRVKEAGVTADGDRLCAIIVPDELWAQGKTDDELERALKREVIEPYNSQTEPYKRVLAVRLFRGELPRTRMEKLQRYKLAALLASETPKSAVETADNANKANVFIKPNDQSKACFSFGMARKRRMESNDDCQLEEYHLIRHYIEEEKRVTVHPTDHLETDLALDSLDKVGLQSFVEQTFGMNLPSERLAAFSSVQQLAEYVSECKTRMEAEHTADWASMLGENSSHIRLPRSGWGMRTIVAAGRRLSRSYFGLEALGTDNLPAEVPFIVAPNHQSYLDGLFVAACLPREAVNNTFFFAKRDHVRTPFARWMARHNGVIVVDHHTHRESILTLGEALKQRRNVVIFPEGTRTVTGSLGTFKRMFAILASELHVPIVPVVIRGAYAAIPKGRHIPLRRKVTVEFLPPVLPDGKMYDALSDEVRESIENQIVNRKSPNSK